MLVCSFSFYLQIVASMVGPVVAPVEISEFLSKRELAGDHRMPQPERVRVQLHPHCCTWWSLTAAVTALPPDLPEQPVALVRL